MKCKLFFEFFRFLFDNFRHQFYIAKSSHQNDVSLYFFTHLPNIHLAYIGYQPLALLYYSDYFHSYFLFYFP